ncbi:MAG: YdhR family protein [Oscillatoriales cyanobacterium SM2_1_8]|nr:YdhR family protein [Oscillatoriales cyanobacterium SM2_1_8]
MKYAQIFRYKLSLSPEEYKAQWQEPYAKDIATVPGLIRKTWMADFEAGVYASVYIWQDKASMDAFMKSDAIAKVAAEPFLSDLTITEIPVHEEASLITRGI